MDKELDLHPQTYEWMIRLFNRVRKVLGLKIKLHGSPELLHEGEIFVFNHFARVETFLPHWFIYKETGAYCRSIASRSLFRGNDAFAAFLRRTGAIPNDHEELLPTLVAEILRGRKVIIFPEGGMVKDRKVQDERGKFRIYSREARAYRKHHSGAAVLASAVNAVKQAILLARRQRDWKRVDQWREILALPDGSDLFHAVHRPANVVPCNITFFPLRTDENFFLRQKKLFNKNLDKRAREELIIESNLLFKDTDMDMRVGRPIYIADSLSWREKLAQQIMARNMSAIHDFHTLRKIRNPLLEGIVRRAFRRGSEGIRDQYMRDIYAQTTINVNHLASAIIMALSRRGQPAIDRQDFFRCVYLAVKNLQQAPKVHLHRGLRNPLNYRALLTGEHQVVGELLAIASRKQLLDLEGGRISLRPKLQWDYGLDTVRLANPIQVYANEMAPVDGAREAVEEALAELAQLTERRLAECLLDDEKRNHDWHYKYYSRPRFDAVNERETATESGRPYLLRGREEARRTGILLVHGFLASPAEMRPVAETLAEAGYAVYAARLAGHGTSPADLMKQSWQDWRQSVATGYDLLRHYADDMAVLGFSTGGLLALLLAAAHPPHLRSVIAVNGAMKFHNKAIHLAPLLEGVSKVVSPLPALEKSLLYRPNDAEHPEINYRSIPIPALTQLLQLRKEVADELAHVKVPCLLIHSSQDPIIAPESAGIIREGLVNAQVSFAEIEAARHGILYENTGNAFSEILAFIQRTRGTGENAQ